MLLIGDANIAIDLFYKSKLKDSLYVWNLSSLKDFGMRLDLIPTTDMNIYDPMFDQFFANYVFSNDRAFVAFMNIVYQLYEGYNVFICIGKNDVSETLAESITKLIQVRYGYTCQFVNEINDIDFDDESEFNTAGIYTFNNEDRNRYYDTMIKLGMDVTNFYI